jgi:YegS/Rv2252/BmrU family lipid kinase
VATDPGRWLAIVNPAAGRRDGGAGWRAVEAALREAKVAFDAVQTQAVGDATGLAAQALRDGRRRLIAVGGDGSVNEIVHGVMDAGLADTREVTLALAPHGTGNDWARSIAMPLDPRGIARTIAADRTMLHDVGAVDFPAEPQARRRWFINVAGAGYDAVVTARVPRPVPSAVTYLRIALEGLASYRSPQFRVRADGQAIEGRLLLVFVANARYCGNRMHVAPTACVDDGLLDVLAVRELSLIEVLPKLLKLYRGRILGDPAVRHLRAARVSIETDPPAIVQADGQLLSQTPAEFSVLRQALRVVTGLADPAQGGSPAARPAG